MTADMLADKLPGTPDMQDSTAAAAPAGLLPEREIVSLFLRLASHDAPSRCERAVADDIRTFLERLGCTVTEDDAAARIGGNTGNLFCRIPGTLPGPPVLFCTHMDTVEPCSGKKIELTPDRILRSDGTTILGADDVAGIVAVLTSVAWLIGQAQPHRTIELLFTVAEEVHLQGSRHYDASPIQAASAYVLDANKAPGIAVVAAPGHISFEIAVHGRSAHAGINPEEGVSAITVAAEAIAAMPLGRVDAGTTANIGRIEGGSVTNVVADSCRFTAECRSLDAGRLRIQADAMRRCLEQAAERRGARVEIAETVNYLPYSVAADSLAVRQFQAACATVGIEPAFITLGGGTDLNNLTQQGVHGIVISCGMQLMHSCAEYLPLDDLLLLTRLVTQLMTLEGS